MPADHDLAMLEVLLVAYDEALSAVVGAVRGSDRPDGGNPAEQDRFVADLTGLFATRGWAYDVVDRRLAPTQGYRAVHVVVCVDQLPVEVQVRTAWQHQWAESFEKIADRLGRGIRYSSVVDPDDVLASLGFPGLVSERVRSAATELTTAVLDTALAQSMAIAEAEAALVAGAAAEQVDDIAATCIAAVQRVVRLLDTAPDRGYRRSGSPIR